MAGERQRWAAIATTSLTSEERLLSSKLDAATYSNPPLAGDVIESLVLPEACRTTTCWLEDNEIGRLSYSDGDLRQSEDGIIFQLEGSQMLVSAPAFLGDNGIRIGPSHFNLRFVGGDRFAIIPATKVSDYWSSLPHNIVAREAIQSPYFIPAIWGRPSVHEWTTGFDGSIRA